MLGDHIDRLRMGIGGLLIAKWPIWEGARGEGQRIEYKKERLG
jgi:hypothetical protein